MVSTAGFNSHRQACPNGREVKGTPLTQQEDTSVVPGDELGILRLTNKHVTNIKDT